MKTIIMLYFFSFFILLCNSFSVKTLTTYIIYFSSGHCCRDFHRITRDDYYLFILQIVSMITADVLLLCDVLFGLN